MYSILYVVLFIFTMCCFVQLQKVPTGVISDLSQIFSTLHETGFNFATLAAEKQCSQANKAIVTSSFFTSESSSTPTPLKTTTASLSSTPFAEGVDNNKFGALQAGIFLSEVAPPLDGSGHKGSGGRIGILGGSIDYTGAPFYAVSIHHP